jgi:hypothetical protein
MRPHQLANSGAGVSPATRASRPGTLYCRRDARCGRREARPIALLAGLCCLLALVAVGLGGCVSKSKADAQARAAYLAGQQEAAARMQQAQGSSVTINGEVRNHVVPWTQGLTLARAMVAADYYGAKDPGQLFLVHKGVATRVDPKQLLSGVDIPLQPGDIVQVVPQAAPPKE